MRVLVWNDCVGGFGGAGLVVAVWADRWCILDLWVLCDVGSLGVLLVCKNACWLLLLNCLNLCGFACYCFGLVFCVWFWLRFLVLLYCGSGFGVVGMRFVDVAVLSCFVGGVFYCLWLLMYC